VLLVFGNILLKINFYLRFEISPPGNPKLVFLDHWFPNLVRDPNYGRGTGGGSRWGGGVLT
jgi:hypothetical protein